MPRSRPSTPPRSSRARKLPASRSRDRGARTRELSVRSKRPGRASPGVSGALRFLAVMLGMALLGFALVFIADGLDRIASRSDEMDGLVDKVIDRLLDRDVPRKARDVVEPAVPPPKPSSTGGDAPPKRTSGRADLDAPTPEDYARESVGPRAPAKAKKPPAAVVEAPPTDRAPAKAKSGAAAAADRARIDEIVRKVTTSL